MGNLRTKDLSKIGYHDNQLRSLVIGIASKNFKHHSKQQLADKCGINKSRISKVENDIGNVPVSILRTVIEKGLGGQFHIAFEF